jgi:hypothetical protein
MGKRADRDEISDIKVVHQRKFYAITTKIYDNAKH